MSLSVDALAELRALRASMRQREREDEQRSGPVLAADGRGRDEAAPATQQMAAQIPIDRRCAHDDRRDGDLFASAVGPVQRVQAPARAALRRVLPPPMPVQRERDEQAALQASLSDAVDPSSLLETDDRLSFRRPGVAADVLRRLRRGEWSIQSELDLHGLTRAAARERLGSFLSQAQRQGWRCLRVVHGKGNRSPGRVAVLKLCVGRWLAQSDCVMAFAQAQAVDGGAGALLVLLRPLQPTALRGPGRQLR